MTTKTSEFFKNSEVWVRNVGWTVEKFVEEEKKEKPKTSKSAPAKKAKPAAKKPAAKAKPAKKTSSSKGKKKK